jgi:hypothetical protein
MSIQADMMELKSINTEIHRLDGIRKKLKNDAGIVNKRIVDYLREHGQKGVKTKDDKGVDTAFILHTAQKTINKPASDKVKDAIEILKNNGVAEPERVLKELEDGRKGNKVPIHKLKIIQNK